MASADQVTGEVRRKFLKSGCAALPLTSSPWEGLAKGLFISIGQLADLVDALSAEGALLGVWCEPNPASIYWSEVSVAREAMPPTVIRWRAVDERGVAVGSALRPSAMDAPIGGRTWFKAGLPLRFDEFSDNPGFDSADRSMLVAAQEAPPFRPGGRAEEILLALCGGIAVSGREDFWTQLARASGCRVDELRLAIREFLISRVVRRFALRAGLAGLGWRGCGIAEWAFSSGGDAQLAARALAEAPYSGDVSIRVGPGENLLEALIMGLEPGRGRRLAASVGERWGLPARSWTDVRFQ